MIEGWVVMETEGAHAHPVEHGGRGGGGAAWRQVKRQLLRWWLVDYIISDCTCPNVT